MLRRLSVSLGTLGASLEAPGQHCLTTDRQLGQCSLSVPIMYLAEQEHNSASQELGTAQRRDTAPKMLSFNEHVRVTHAAPVTSSCLGEGDCSKAKK